MAERIHQRPPFRAEHLGSLLRPKVLSEKRIQLDGEKAVVIASDKELQRLENEAIDDIVKLQIDLGYHAVTDGEYRRHQFWGTFFPALEGMDEIADPPLDIFRLYVPDLAAFTEAGHKPGESIICVGKIKHAGSTYIDQWNYLKTRLPAERVKEAKLTLPAPEWYHLRYKTGHAYPKDVYANDEEYFADIAAAYRSELRILYEAGCRNVTIDDPNLAYFCSEKMLQGFQDVGEDADALFDSYIKLYNDCLSTRPADFHVGLHLCRGNFAYSRHFSEGGYDRVASRLFREINVDTYFLEYDTERSGGFEPLRELPAHKNVIVGVITSKFPKLEDLVEMRARVHEAADYVAQGSGQSRDEALKRLGVSPQCGFASHHLGNSVTKEDMINKLKLVRQLADSIWAGEP
ncbi:methyltetrahydropteroyltriglutamate-homocysteine s-methyltransferase [Grosmannia clavigera kw1407]|uniref:Methyltetrahydropteroyltriglutamate-homocysteine s-methyltransferase n=1 Tax=Grosmannia clavigera (strain kw1407 / UAMH 11150) TaxID=655863 RepID=F0XJA1_GROCL|nr:methyltetrahydropteroyltriglutamate-homocysteine s-methyltransferase [Grosmannia clavigera kw1407]EFX02231.1 methyltetrahydropteroyltriglutamate-homocysteine s-methyltransferase [Grosmannia clavigera kw1407]